MPPCYLRRPLFLALIAYAALLFALRARGRFNVELSPDLSALVGRHSVLDARAVSPPARDYWGERIVVEALPERNRRILVRLSAPWTRGGFALPGEIGRFWGRLELPHPVRNPGDFDEKTFLSDQGISAVFWAEDFCREPLAVPRLWIPFYLAQKARSFVEAGFFENLGADEARVLSGIVFGDKGGLDPRIGAAISGAGAMHLLVPSGAKVALAFFAAAGLLSWMGLGRAGRFFGSAAIAGAYTLMVGLAAPYSRAYFSAIVFYGSMLLDCECGPFQGLVLSAWAALILDRRSLFSAGFQMTYAAVFGIIASESFAPRVAGLKTIQRTAVVEVMLWPFFAGIFGQAAVLGSISNVIMIPFAALLMAAGAVLGGACALRWLPLIHAASLAASAATRRFCQLCFLFASLPGAHTALLPMTWYAVIAYYAILLAVLIDTRPFFRGALIAAAAGFWALMAARAAAGRPAVRVVYLWPASLDQALVFERGRVIRIGRGPPPREIFSAMRGLRLEKIDENIAPRGRLWICRGGACAGFNPPGLRIGRRQFDIIGSLLKGRWVDLQFDEKSLRITDGSGTARYPLGNPFLQ
ncbi:MAG: ComEC/Rec2 family competence protein [Elusimicrobiota bacterium]